MCSWLQVHFSVTDLWVGKWVADDAHKRHTYINCLMMPILALVSIVYTCSCLQVHFSVADLWVGKWVADDAHKRRINRLIMMPILAAGMMLGPVGLGSYLLVRPFVGARAPKRD